MGATGRLTLLAAALRAGGVRLGVGKVLAARRALAATDPGDPAAAYFALRTTLCSRHEDLAAFDAAFAEWFGRPSVNQPASPTPDKDFARRRPSRRRGAPPHGARPDLRRTVRASLTCRRAWRHGSG